ncbi:MAG: hypothetical protein L3J08_06585 [Flavobacteriaceae bacterium]|nr:hypothetical protein [Flavobacteriaceae bacterium]
MKKMNKNDLINEIISIKNAKRIYRDRATSFVIKNPEIFPFLLELTFENEKRMAIKSSWVLELVCFENINLLIPHLNYFVENLHNVNHESMLRPLSKICSFIANIYDLSNQNEIKKKLTTENKIQIIEVSFDWLIGNHKVATQVFAIDTLFLLGKYFDWVHTELKLVLKQNINKGSAGYQVRAKRVLERLDN